MDRREFLKSSATLATASVVVPEMLAAGQTPAQAGETTGEGRLITSAPMLQKARCQLVITAHMHAYRYDAPTRERKWAQLVGGGPEMIKGQGFPTLIEGRVEGQGKARQLRITVHNIRTGEIQDKFRFDAR